MRSVTEAMREATSLLEAASVSIQFQRQCVFASYRRRLLLCARHEWVSLARRPTAFSVHRWQPEYSETALTGKVSEWRLWRENMVVYLAELKLAFALHTRHAGPSKSIIR